MPRTTGHRLLLATLLGGGLGAGCTLPPAPTGPPPHETHPSDDTLQSRPEGWLRLPAFVSATSARRELEEALAATLQRWPGVLEARVHLDCPPAALARWEPAPSCEAAVVLVLAPERAAAASPAPRVEEVQQLVVRASPVGEPSRVTVLTTTRDPAPAAAATPHAAAAGAGPRHTVGPFVVAAASAQPLRLCLAAAGLLVGLLAGWVLWLRRQARRGRRGEAGRACPPGVSN
ncbi:MAG: hypothetical protein RBU45_21510 [Myxococcota bacterium]|jgi:hypothetical protein|nr:hypothetical protein [Myxococcota bacterium]